MRRLLSCLSFILLCFLFYIFRPAPESYSAADDQADQALEDARRFSDKGEFAKALERHEWYHANALRINPAQYGVRLSFALSDWMDLANQYPPALASLKRLRDEGTKTIEDGKGTGDLFDDVEAINGRLSENAATVALFKKLDATQPELAEQCFYIISRTLIAKNEMELYAKYVGDLKTHLAGEIDTFNEVAARIRKSGERVGSSFEPGRSQLIATTLGLAKLATERGDPVLAAELKAMTAKVIQDPRLEK